MVNTAYGYGSPLRRCSMVLATALRALRGDTPRSSSSASRAQHIVAARFALTPEPIPSQTMTVVAAGERSTLTTSPQGAAGHLALWAVSISTCVYPMAFDGF